MYECRRSYAIYHDRLGPLTKKDVILRATRAIASQWLNQLVTPRSWKHNWLNEGVTEYLKYHIADKVSIPG